MLSLRLLPYSSGLGFPLSWLHFQSYPIRTEAEVEVPVGKTEENIVILERIHGNGFSDKASNNIKSLLHIIILIS